MIKKKNGFLRFVCSLFPGAGEMYLGFMKEGVSIMSLALASIFAIAWLGMNWLVFGFVLIWFYSLFNVHNKASLSDEEFYALEDDYLFHLDQFFPEGNLNGKQTKILGWLLLLSGISIIWGPSVKNLLEVLRTYISPEFATLVGRYLYNIPQFIVAAILMISGIRLIIRKKTELDMEPELEIKEKE